MVRTRIAPSPTGKDLHIGNLYTALINWVWARKNNGQFIIRIEDTDRTRLVKGTEKKILKTLRLYGLNHDEGPDIKGKHQPYQQSKRLDLYKKYAEELVKKGKAYYCFCSKQRLDEVRAKMRKKGQVPKYDRHCLKVKPEQKKTKDGNSYVIRLKVPEDQEICFNDLIRGEIKFNSQSLDDQVLLKSDGYPTYHLAVVVDDYLMKISHVIRAEEWISSTPKHVLLYKAFGWQLPVYVHLPLLRNSDRSKLSKRKNAVSASWYLEQGFLPEAVLNYLALMGWSHPQQKEIFSLEEFIKVFDLKDISPVGPAFDRVKLEWMNGEYLRKTQNSKLKTQLLKFYQNKFSEKIVDKTIPLIKERIKKLSDYEDYCQFFFKAPEEYQMNLDQYKDLFQKIYQKLLDLDQWKAKFIGEKMIKLAKEQNLSNSKFFMILRVAICGKKITPPLNESIEILGKEKTLQRIKKLF